jgi:hypothetical protein
MVATGVGSRFARRGRTVDLPAPTGPESRRIGLGVGGLGIAR